ncbi:MAG: metallophosphoesterase [Candidatus Latescibacteria bacterium]|nr:metallophosphoesterase [Candidatus Latescibacterota bacterium]
MLTIVKGPYLQWPTRESVTIMWETGHEATGEVVYWETAPVAHGLAGRARTLEETQRRLQERGRRRIHSITLTGLQAEAVYHYRVRSVDAQGDQVESDVYPVKTAVRTETPFSFAVTSESGGYGDGAINDRIFPLIAGFRPDFLLMVGDAVGNGQRYQDWDEFFFAPARNLLHDTPFYLCPGNHEENASWFYDLTAYPAPGNYYAFDYGNTRFVGLDSTPMVDFMADRPTGQLQPGAAQVEFLERQLAGEAQWKIVFFHYPPYVSGDYQVASMRALCPLLEEAGVDLVFNSHTIVYERSHPLKGGQLAQSEGTVYVVAGGCGAKPDWFHPQRAWHTAQALAVPHFVQVVVAGGRLELHAFDMEGRLFDLLVLEK